MIGGEVVVRPGQVWADNDPREGPNGRRVKIERLCERAECLRGRSHGGSADKHHAHCVSSAGRSTVIAIRRFRPTASGYRLVKDASDG